MFKIAFKLIFYSQFVFLSLTTFASWKKVNCPEPSAEMGLEAFLFTTNGIKQGFDPKCTKDYKFFDLDEIELSDSGSFLKISPKDIQVKILKISPSNVVFYEITYKDEFNKKQTSLINVLTRRASDGEDVEDSACASVLSAKPDNLIRKECI